jgi:hypothetical protein
MSVASYCVAIGLLAGTTGTALAKGDLYAYVVDGNTDFGVIDLNTGSVNVCGNNGIQLAGIGVGPNGTIYAATWLGNTVWTVNPSNGALTEVGTTGLQVAVFGSTTDGYLYGMDLNSELYSIDPSTGASTPIGNTGIALSGGYGSISVGSGKIYVSNYEEELYATNARTAKSKFIGAGSVVFGAMLKDKGVLYGGNVTGNPGVYTVDTATGADVLVASVTGLSGGFFGLTPTPKGSNGTCPTE